jgi:hypothetical protein
MDAVVRILVARDLGEFGELGERPLRTESKAVRHKTNIHSGIHSTDLRN